MQFLLRFFNDSGENYCISLGFSIIWAVWLRWWVVRLLKVDLKGFRVQAVAREHTHTHTHTRTHTYYSDYGSSD